jgi:hypothetical protein
MIATFPPAGIGLGHLASGEEDARTCGLFSEAGGKRR